MNPFPITTPARSKAEIRAFFDEFAAENFERHGPAEALLHHRLEVLGRHANFDPNDIVLDVGCGDGAHLRALSDRIGRGIGIDLAPRMIENARRQTDEESLSFQVDDAEQLRSIPDGSVDVVICVGVLEHVLSPTRVFRSVRRVLRDGGRFVALTLNGTYWWYRFADQFQIPTRHLTSDQRLQPIEARRLLRRTGLRPHVGFWQFIPSGDLPATLSHLCHLLDSLGRRVSTASLRGGLRLYGRPV